ncbi:MAG: AAA family ATPase, partial [Romboutsia sp.]|nr:AAA family ATPase [Romboutsia sp.]
MNISILNEKFRPTTLDDFLCSPENREKFEEFIKKQDIPHIGLFGEPGSGKTTLAKIFRKQIDCDYLYLNAMDERGMDVLRDKVKSFASSATFYPLKIVILDEATHIRVDSQVLLLNMIETYSKDTRFILTGNYPQRLIEPLRSRLQEFNLVPPKKSEIANMLCDILQKENVEYTVEDVAAIINKYYPDIRRVINMTQKNIINNKLSLANLDSSYSDYCDN